MGCVETESTGVTTDMLKTQLRKIKYSLDIQKQRIEKDRLKGEEFLIAEFRKLPGQRSKKLERAMIIGNAKLLNQKNSKYRLKKFITLSRTKPT